MFRKFSEWAISYAVAHGYISKDETEEYVYGFDLILSVLLSDITMVVIGLIMHMPIEAVILLFMYKIIRKNTGGFHCESAITCYISSCIMCVCVLLVIKYCPYNMYVYMPITVASTAVLFILSPIEAINKPLDELEKKVFGRRARIILCVMLLIYFVMGILGQHSIVKAMSVTVWDITLFAIMGKLKLMNYYKKRAVA